MRGRLLVPSDRHRTLVSYAQYVLFYSTEDVETLKGVVRRPRCVSAQRDADARST